MNTYASPLVVKYGGNALPASGEDPLLDEVAALARSGRPVCLVHGGGPEIDAELVRRGIASVRVDGLRVTDAASLDATESVLCATINKRLVRALAARGARCAGISGQDGEMLRAVTARGGALGYVGEVERVDVSLLHALLGAGFIPVVAPVALSPEFGALNVNADTAAAAIAVALRAQALVFVTNVARVLRDPADATSAIETMTVSEAQRFASSTACTDGMRPKMEAAILAASHGVCVAIGAAGAGAVARAVSGDATSVLPLRAATA